MCTGLSIIFLFPFLISAEQNRTQSSPILADKSHVAIHLHGDVADEYVRLLRNQKIFDAFLKDGSVIVEGFADTVGDGTVRIYHVTIVRISGEPLRLLRLESVIDANLVKHEQIVAYGVAGVKTNYRVDLSDPRSAGVRSSVLVGDFPDSRSYH